MEYTTKKISEAQLNEIAGLIVNKDAKINFDINDVKSFIEGKEGLLFVATQGKNETHEMFMKSFFNELSQKPEVTACNSIILSIQFTENDNMMMEDMNIINDFISRFHEECEAKWGLNILADSNKMKIIVGVTTNKIG